MASIKGIYRRKGSDIYQASVKRYNRSTGKWQWYYVSTHTADPAKALKTREEYQALEDEIAKHGNSSLTREKAFQVVDNILRWHGIPEISDASSSSVTLRGFVDSWLADIQTTGSDASYGVCKTHTASFCKFIGDDVPLAGIQRRKVQDWYNGLAEKQLKASTLANYLKSIRRLFRDAIDEGIITRNPAVKLKTVTGSSRPKDPFTRNDIDVILNRVQDLEHADEWRIVVIFGLCLGARINDCTIRKWDEIKLTRKSPHIEYRPEKTKRRNVLVKAPIVDPLLSVLKSLSAKKGGFITPNLAKIRADGGRGLSKEFSQLIKDAWEGGQMELRFEEAEGKGHDWYSKSFHSFRHTLPSLLAAANVPAEIRMGIVGHTRLETHLGYTHHDDEQMRGALETALADVGEV